MTEKALKITSIDNSEVKFGKFDRVKYSNNDKNSTMKLAIKTTKHKKKNSLDTIEGLNEFLNEFKQLE
jgi:hypothetical protein